jgi:hypothetical protein
MLRLRQHKAHAAAMLSSILQAMQHCAIPLQIRRLLCSRFLHHRRSNVHWCSAGNTRKQGQGYGTATHETNYIALK